MWLKKTICCYLLLILIFSAASPSLANENKAEENRIHYPLAPHGRVWVWQQIPRHPSVTWDFGIETMMEILAGKGHRLWFGARYRLGAGFNETSTVTPFDPREVDSYQLLSYRYERAPLERYFIHIERYCFHEIDQHNPGATWLTNMAFGIGTYSPAEQGEAPKVAQQRGRATVGGYIYAGPFVHGGPQQILGEAPVWQWETGGQLAGTYPFTRVFLVESAFHWRQQILLPNAGNQVRHRVALKTSFLFQKERGNVGLYIERNFFDNSLMRSTGVGWRFGIEHRY
ncbi:hypothetical protein K8I28_05010 [bacterium]|nr:hypothetical protein [bacterium]